MVTLTLGEKAIPISFVALGYLCMWEQVLLVLVTFALDLRELGTSGVPEYTQYFALVYLWRNLVSIDVVTQGRGQSDGWLPSKRSGSNMPEIRRMNGFGIF